MTHAMPTTHPDTDAATDPLALVARIAALASDKKAADIVALDLRGASGFTDAFVVCSGNTERQVKAIHDAVHFGLKDVEGLLPRRVEGATEARWILMDYADVVVHVFTPETRDYYRLESLWGDVPRIGLDPEVTGEATPATATPEHEA